MPRSAPYLQRRGFSLSFRISVPLDLRPIFNKHEITKALPTSNRRQAVPMALEYAACAKRMFFELRAAMTASNNNEEQTQMIDPLKLQKLSLETKFKLKHIDTIIEYEDEAAQKNREHRAEIAEKDRQHKTDLQHARLEAENETMRRVLAGSHTSTTPILTVLTKVAPERLVNIPSATLKNAIDSYLSDYKRNGKAAMFKKHEAALPLLLEIIGNKPISEVMQEDIIEFFNVINNLPPRWQDACRKQKLSVRQLSKLDHKITISPKTFKSNYIAPIRLLLNDCLPSLSVDKIKYVGSREAGESKQRAFKPSELKRLFEGLEMGSFASDQAKAHFFWLPLIGLYTGARVNEICQLNPQTDILKDEETGVEYFWMTADTKADARIDKSIKTGESRKVPIHKHLIALGFMQYVERVKSSGATLLFPEWSPINRRASGEAEKWFRKLLADTGLRDDTPKNKLLGMHAFRHTLLTYGAKQRPKLILTCITGHEQNDALGQVSDVAKGYMTDALKMPIDELYALLNELDYGLNHFKPSII